MSLQPEIGVSISTSLPRQTSSQPNKLDAVPTEFRYRPAPQNFIQLREPPKSSHEAVSWLTFKQEQEWDIYGLAVAAGINDLGMKITYKV